ncbi:hypothetical protein MBLNU230_g3807t1 [Neophaeotheca triangularis]
MPSTKEIETSLPLTAPAPVRKAPQGYNFLVYITANLDKKQRETLQFDIHDYSNTAKVSKFAPGNYTGKSIREVYQQHLNIRDNEPTAHPTLFIVADGIDWKTHGLLVLDLAVRTEERHPRHVIGVVRTAASGALGAEILGMNLEIGNRTWTEVKKTEMTEFGGEDPLSNRRYYLVDPRTAESPVYDSVVYAWYSLARRAKAIARLLEPGVGDMDEGESRFALQDRPTASEAEPWDVIRRQHPWACLSSQRVHRWLLLVALETDADTEKGMAIYKAKWNADLSGFGWDINKADVRPEDKERLLGVMPELEFVEYVSASKALERLDAIDEQC